MDQPALSAREIIKKFAGVTALKGVSFDLRPGEIHALCGENGAGKSTLIKLLSGIHPHGSYEGTLEVGGKVAEFHSIADAEEAGLAVIYQELALVEPMSVAENIFLGSEPRKFGFIDWPRVYQEARALLDRFQVKIDPAMPIERLGVGQKQLVEIVKALAKNSRILILDEPTAALAEHEVQILLNIMRDLRSQGIACIYISHKLEEVFAVADRITVLRDGSSVASFNASETNKNEIIRHMVGREIADLFPRRARSTDASTDKPALRIENLSVSDPHTRKLRLENVNLSLAPGEVLGIGGLMGAGRTELLMHLCGAWGKRESGTVELAGKNLPPLPPAEVFRLGLAIVSEDRRRYGLVLEQTIGFNLSLASLHRLTRGGLVDDGQEFEENDRSFKAFRIKAPSLEAIAGRLSGGNQQKIVIGKALMTGPSVVLLDEPTRGIDVSARAEIYRLIATLAAEGVSILLASSELPELLAVCDRILVLSEGRLAATLDRTEATQERILQAALTNVHIASNQ